MSNQSFAQDYNDVASRLRQFREKYPDGSLQPADLTKPYTVETIGNDTYIVYCAAAFRTPDDVRPGVGIAWEPVPGKTNFTRGSEIQNAETSAWGRAIVATLAADTKRIASDEEIASSTRSLAARPATAARILELATDIEKYGNDEFRTWVAEEFHSPWTEADVDEIAAAFKPHKEAAFKPAITPRVKADA